MKKPVTHRKCATVEKGKFVGEEVSLIEKSILKINGMPIFLKKVIGINFAMSEKFGRSLNVVVGEKVDQRFVSKIKLEGLNAGAESKKFRFLTRGLVPFMVPCSRKLGSR